MKILTILLTRDFERDQTAHARLTAAYQSICTTRVFTLFYSSVLAHLSKYM